MQRFDLSFPLTNELFERMEKLAAKHTHIQKIDLFGHIGTHLDLMGKPFPEDYFTLSGRVFDVQKIAGRDIETTDINLDCIAENDFVFLHSGCLSSLSYGSDEYMADPIQLSWDLIDNLISKKVAMIGIDFAGIRQQKEHHKADTICAEAGTFVVENVYSLENLPIESEYSTFTVNCYPTRLADATGLPCRVIAEI
ncbi:cyclase family protein [Maridesulfovibrio sp.]|uniref:cyclase family protein n=1 Tax=Maridesulfovibrio sp. TaxID=2795000 RepID=UPI002A18A71D|nr:cyclase family protein [Maridesulfovibrio sp.]